jgi:hypothetical protein
VLGSKLVTTLPGALPLRSSPERIALRGQRLVAASADGETIVAAPDTTDRGCRVTARLSLSTGVGPLALSASGRFLMAHSETSDHAAVHDLDAGVVILELVGRPGVTGSVVAALTQTEDRELVLVSTAAGELRGHELPGGRPVLAADARPYAFEHLVAVGGGGVVIALGHYPTEGRDSLLTLPVAVLLADARTAQRVVAERLGIDDYAYVLAAGPCGPDAVVIYRDPEDEEQPDDEGPDEVPASRPDVYGFRGFYVRRLADGALLGRVPAAVAITTGAELFATSSAVVVGHADRVEVFDRRQPAAPPVVLPGSAHGLDPEGGRIATAKSDGTFELHQVAP